MFEFWVVYDPTDGSERWRGSGPVGASAIQAIPEGLKVALVPPQALSGLQIDLDIMRAFACQQIDQAAETLRMRYLTPGAGQAITYTRKEAEARAWSADNSVATPFLSAEAQARGMQIAHLALEVIGQADAWVQVGAAIEAIRMGAKSAALAAATFGAIVEAAEIQWSA